MRGHALATRMVVFPGRSVMKSTQACHQGGWKIGRGWPADSNLEDLDFGAHFEQFFTNEVMSEVSECGRFHFPLSLPLPALTY